MRQTQSRHVLALVQVVFAAVSFGATAGRGRMQWTNVLGDNVEATPTPHEAGVFGRFFTTRPNRFWKQETD